MIGLSPLSTGHPLRFQPKWVRPSTGSYPRFSLPMGSSPGFASTTRDSCRRLKDSLSLRLASKLNLAAHRDSLAHSTKGTPSHRDGCSDCSWARGFRRCFTPLSGCFSPFPHGTGSLSVSREYLALPDGPGRFAQDSSCPALLRIPLCCISLHILDYHRLWSHFPKCSVHDLHTMSRSYNPAGALRRQRFGLFPVRSPLLGESFIYFLFLQVLRCFSSLR